MALLICGRIMMHDFFVLVCLQCHFNKILIRRKTGQDRSLLNLLQNSLGMSGWACVWLLKLKQINAAGFLNAQFQSVNATTQIWRLTFYGQCI